MNPSLQVSFREIYKKRALNLYFDQDGCNVFQENEFFSSICNEEGIDIDENEDPCDENRGNFDRFWRFSEALLYCCSAGC